MFWIVGVFLISQYCVPIVPAVTASLLTWKSLASSFVRTARTL